MFIEENGGLNELGFKLSENQNIDGGYSFLKGNDIINQEFKDFHKKHAKLQLLTREEHLEKTK